MMRVLLIVLLILATTAVLAADSPSKYALFVGVAKYKHTDMHKPQLEFPEEDAKELAEIFRKSGYTVDLLLGKQATQDAIKAKLKELNKKGDSDGVVVLGFFGHGVEFESTKIACFCPYDTTIRDVVGPNGKPLPGDDGKSMIEPDPESLITMADLLGAMRTTPAGNRILLADCCRTSPNTARGRAFGADVKLTDLPANMAAFFAGSANEKAYEHRDWGHGAFTKCLIDEIKLQSKNGTVTAGTLGDQLRPKVNKLVASVTGGKDRQTVEYLVPTLIDFQLSTSISTTTTPPASPPLREAPLLIAPFDRTAAQSAQKSLAKSRNINIITKNRVGGEMVLIPPREFIMGNEDSVEDLLKLFPYVEKDVFEAAEADKVRITRAYLLGKHEVTIGQFRQFVDATGYETDAEKDGSGGIGFVEGEFKQDVKFNWRNTGFEPKPTDDHSVVCVSWNDAVAFCNWLSLKEGKPEYYRIDYPDVSVVGGTGYRLPTEAEWEYACRAGTTTMFYNGSDPEGLIKIDNTLDAQAKTKFGSATKLPPSLKFPNGNDGFAFTSPVGRFGPNNFGLYGMAGNVSEWCDDWYGQYDLKAANDPVGATSGSERVVRGGCWLSPAFASRSAYRQKLLPDISISFVGFRLAAVLSK